MCDQDHFQEDLKKYTRRDVSTIAAALGLAALLPQGAYAQSVKESDVTIRTPDGDARVAGHLRPAARDAGDG
jgi:carboxymethylenebutenolidase